jgi:AcrR family transcriptional regulator
MSTAITPVTPPHKSPGSRDARRRAIVDAAKRAFLRDGYEGTSVDTIAELAGVSKQTIYNHGSDKDSLFLQVIADMTAHCATTSVAAIEAIPTGQDRIEDELFALAVALNERVLDPDGMAFRPLIIAEAHRNPERGRQWALDGQNPVMDALAERFRALMDAGKLQMDDPARAAEQFNALVTYQSDRMSLNGVSDIGLDCLVPGIRSSIAMFLGSYAPVG